MVHSQHADVSGQRTHLVRQRRLVGAVTWLCLGSAYLCFGATEYNKEKQADNKDDEKKDEAEQKEN